MIAGVHYVSGQRRTQKKSGKLLAVYRSYKENMTNSQGFSRRFENVPEFIYYDILCIFMYYCILLCCIHMYSHSQLFDII